MGWQQVKGGLANLLWWREGRGGGRARGSKQKEGTVETKVWGDTLLDYLTMKVNAHKCGVNKLSKYTLHIL